MKKVMRLCVLASLVSFSIAKAEDADSTEPSKGPTQKSPTLGKLDTLEDLPPEPEGLRWRRMKQTAATTGAFVEKYGRYGLKGAFVYNAFYNAYRNGGASGAARHVGEEGAKEVAFMMVDGAYVAVMGRQIGFQCPAKEKDATRYYSCEGVNLAMREALKMALGSFVVQPAFNDAFGHKRSQ